MAELRTPISKATSSIANTAKKSVPKGEPVKPLPDEALEKVAGGAKDPEWRQGAGRASVSKTTRVGRWMSQAEYDMMVATGKVQMSPNGNTTYVANPSDINAFGKQAKPGSIYVEFDVKSDSIYAGGNENWGQISGPGSYWDRVNQYKGLPPIEEMPDAFNIKIVGGK